MHCIAGVSRSVSMVLAYFIREHGMTYQQAYYHVKSHRKIVLLFWWRSTQMMVLYASWKSTKLKFRRGKPKVRALSSMRTLHQRNLDLKTRETTKLSSMQKHQILEIFSLTKIFWMKRNWQKIKMTIIKVSHLWMSPN